VQQCKTLSNMYSDVKEKAYQFDAWLIPAGPGL
jgi:hypothetical protein